MSFEEQIMSKDKYPNTFLRQIEVIVFIILQIFFATRVVLNIWDYPRIFPVLAGSDFPSHGAPDQSRAIESISWFIISIMS